MNYVYILQSLKDGSRYIGTSEDLQRRLKEHNRGDVNSTAPKTPYKLIWYSVFLNKNTAYNFERYLKSSSGYAFTKKRILPP